MPTGVSPLVVALGASPGNRPAATPWSGIAPQQPYPPPTFGEPHIGRNEVEGNADCPGEAAFSRGDPTSAFQDRPAGVGDWHIPLAGSRNPSRPTGGYEKSALLQGRRQER
jgi:hypothetical protein